MTLPETAMKLFLLSIVFLCARSNDGLFAAAEAMELRNPYEVLGIDRDASGSAIRKAYRRMAIELHPDKHQDEKEKYELLFVELANAYDILSDPEAKELFDVYGVDPRDSDGGGGNGKGKFRSFKEAYGAYGTGAEDTPLNWTIFAFILSLAVLPVFLSVNRKSKLVNVLQKELRHEIKAKHEKMEELPCDLEDEESVQRRQEKEKLKRERELRAVQRKKKEEELRAQGLWDHQAEVSPASFKVNTSSADQDTASESPALPPSLARKSKKKRRGVGKQWNIASAQNASAPLTAPNDISSVVGLEATHDSAQCRNTASGDSSQCDSGFGRGDLWTTEQQKALEKALLAYPASMADKKLRWKSIGEAVDGKSAKQCAQRYKEIRSELLKQTCSANHI